MMKCYLCASHFEFTDSSFQTDVLYARISIKRQIEWKDMILTVFAKNSEDEDVVLCKRCLVTVLSRCAQEVRKTNLPLTAAVQFSVS